MFKPKNYRNSTELTTLNGVPIYMHDMVEAALRGRLNVFLQGDTGSGKTQLARDVAHYFGDKSLFILGRNDMDTRELFQQVNPEFLKALKQGDAAGVKFKDLTDRINYNLITIDELPNCVPAVRAQLFNLFDGFIEIDGKAYPIGDGYSVGIATGNIGQQFTESSNELGRALRDRMHLVIDTDYFRPQPIDTFEILTGDRNPRVNFDAKAEDKTAEIREAHRKLNEAEVSDEKKLIALYLIHGLDTLENGESKTKMKSAWPTALENHEAGSDAALVLPVSPRAAKSIITLSQALDQIVQEKGAETPDPLESMMQAFKFTSAYSGILNEALVRQTYGEDHYKAMDAVINATRTEFSDDRKDKIAAGLELADKGKKNERLLSVFSGRWSFMKSLLERLADDKT
ncbi:MAG: AAA family ATPase [Candidatus Nanoarchaeia archaeon]|nr:AAA family ATPase [Candidatus Nanoarchaeia archaeon]